MIDFSGPYAEAARAAFTEAWGVAPVFVGHGGSIPMVADFGKAFPEATILITAVGDPDSRAHGANESLHLGDFAAACLAETLMLEAFAQLDPERPTCARNLRSTSNRNALTVSGSSVAASRRPESNETMAAETSGANSSTSGRVRSAASTLAYQQRSRAKLKARQPLRTALSRRCPSCGSLWASTEAITTWSRSSKGNTAKSCGAGGPYSDAPLWHVIARSIAYQNAGPSPGVETRYRRQRRSGVEVEQITGIQGWPATVVSGYSTNSKPAAGQVSTR